MEKVIFEVGLEIGNIHDPVGEPAGIKAPEERGWQVEHTVEDGGLKGAQSGSLEAGLGESLGNLEGGGGESAGEQPESELVEHAAVGGGNGDVEDATGEQRNEQAEEAGEEGIADDGDDIAGRDFVAEEMKDLGKGERGIGQSWVEGIGHGGQFGGLGG